MSTVGEMGKALEGALEAVGRMEQEEAKQSNLTTLNWLANSMLLLSLEVIRCWAGQLMP